jgi:hypothetical protein
MAIAQDRDMYGHHDGPVYRKQANYRIDKQNRWTRTDTARILGEAVPERKLRKSGTTPSVKVTRGHDKQGGRHTPSLTAGMTGPQIVEVHKKLELEVTARSTRARNKALASVPQWKG